jgi:hypothetical protein
MKRHYPEAVSRLGQKLEPTSDTITGDGMAEAREMWRAMHAFPTDQSPFVNKIVVKNFFCKLETVSSSNLVSSLANIVVDVLGKRPNTGVYTSPSVFAYGDSSGTVYEVGGNPLLVAYVYLLASD